jgi:predicted nuclease of restriction endonuclease-like (RecB) superfamily
MRAFYLAYAVSDQKLSQLVTESDSAPLRKLKQPVLDAPVQAARELHGQKLSQAATQSVRAAIESVASLPWGHNIVLMQKVKEVDARLWYSLHVIRDHA